MHFTTATVCWLVGYKHLKCTQKQIADGDDVCVCPRNAFKSNIYVSPNFISLDVYANKECNR